MTHSRTPGVVTLSELLKFETGFILQLANLLRDLETHSQVSNELDLEVSPESHKFQIAITCAALGRMGDFHAWPLTTNKAQRICEAITEGKLISPRDFHIQLRELRERLDDELKSQYFLHLEPRDIGHYTDPEKGWEDVISRFSKVKQNVIESSKCFALERYGAAVFHILLVAEYGVIQISDLMLVSGDKPGWASLQRLEKAIKDPYTQRDPLAQTHSKLLESTIPLATVMKDSWRHKLTHVDNQIVWQDTDFSREVAEEIITATRGFMRKLASEMPI